MTHKVPPSKQGFSLFFCHDLGTNICCFSGTTKGKLARGETLLYGQDLVLQGDRDSIERARKYVRILLDQRHGNFNVSFL